MQAERLVAIPESKLRMYEQTVAEVHRRTAQTIAMCQAKQEHKAAKQRQYEESWRGQLANALDKLPPEEATAVICVSMGLLIFTVVSIASWIIMGATV